MPGYTVAVSGGGGAATSITGLIVAGENVTITGAGTTADPYVIEASGQVIVQNAHVEPGENIGITGVGTQEDPYVITGVITITHLVQAGENITITGTGTVASPYVINGTAGPASEITGLVSAGAGVLLSGTGTQANPYVIESPVTGLIEAGTNVTFTGAGTSASPYVVSSAGGGEPVHLIGGENIAIDGDGTELHPFVVNALVPPRGEPVPLTLIPPATATGIEPTLTANPDGSVSIDGAFTVAGPLDEAQSIQFATLPQIYWPMIPGSFPGIGSIDQPFQLSAAMVNMAVTGELYVVTPGIEAAATITIHLNGIILWPMKGES